jgi:hypothetical protein
MKGGIKSVWKNALCYYGCGRVRIDGAYCRALFGWVFVLISLFLFGFNCGGIDVYWIRGS